MDSILCNGKKIAEKHKELIVAFLITIMIVGIAVSLGVFVFETNDERDFSNIFSGAFDNTDTEFNGFMNILYGYLLKPLYFMNDSINWYIIVCLVLSVISFVAICYCFIKRMGMPWGVIISILLATGMYYEHFVVLQFTKNAFLYCVAGSLLILENIQNKKKKILVSQTIIGSILLLFGCFIRFKCFVVVFPVAISYIICENFSLKTKKLKENFMAKKKYWLMLLVVFLLIVISYGVNLIAYSKNAEWKEFKEYNAARFEAIDNGTPDYYENEEEYQKLNISEKDLEMFKNWTFADPEKFSKETLLKIGEMKESTGFFSKLNIKKETIIATGEGLLSYCKDYFFLMGIYIISMLVYLAFSKKKDWLIVAVNIGLLVGYTWYLVCMDRLLNRVTFGLVAMSTIFMVYTLVNTEYIQEYTSIIALLKKKRISRRTIIVLIFSAFVVGLPIHMKTYEQGKTVEFNDTYAELLNYAEENPNILFVADRPSMSRLVVNSMSPLSTASAGASNNITYLGGWFSGTPTNRLPLEKFGYKNAFRAMAECENVYLLDAEEENAEQKLDYLRRNYNKQLELETLGQIGELKIFRFIKTNTLGGK